MFEPIKDGSYEEIAGLKCWIPPAPKDDKLILFSEFAKEDQFWRRTPLPEWWFEAREFEIKKQQDDPKYVEGKLQLFRNQEWNRRMNGVHFLNNGQLTYLTGKAYYYMNWWRSDFPENDGYPIYYDEIRKRFYFRQVCEEDPKCLGYVLTLPRGGGKCLGIGTKVRMFEGGVKKVEDIKVGDLLMGDDSTPRKVLKLHHGYDKMYEVVQNKAMNYVVNSQHILSLKRNKGRPDYIQYGEIANIPVFEIIQQKKNFYQVFSGYKHGCEYSEKEIKIDPYFLGLWLGDGHSSNPSITTMEPETVEYCTEYAEKLGLEFHKTDCTSKHTAPTYNFRSTLYRSYKNVLLDLLREEGLINNKHIPFNYLYNSRENRLKLLAGILDTDAYYHHGHYEVAQCRKHLRDEIKMLADTLGYRTTTRIKIVKGKEYYIVNISGTNDEVPTRVPRRKSVTNPNKCTYTTRINEIKYLGVGEYFGFELDGNRLFLLEDGTVTHNTSEECSCVIESLTRGPRKRKGAIQSKSEEDAKVKVFKEKIVPSYNDLPDFFKPISNHGTVPDKMLSFFRPSVRGKKAKDVTYEDAEELQNLLYPVPAKEKYLSGGSYAEILNDEIGITDPKKEADVDVRMQVNRFCVYRNHKKIGLIRSTTTVEEMDKGGAEFKKVWDKSNQQNKNTNGFTTSGLYRYFGNDLDTSIQFADKYGVIDRVKAQLYHDAERKSREKDHKELMSYIRKFPRTEAEMFIVRSDNCHFDAYSITQRLEAIKHMEIKPYRFGNFEWKDGVRHTEVIWMPCGHPESEYEEDRDTYIKICRHCRFCVSYIPPADECNQVTSQYYGDFKSYAPLNEVKYSAGADPYVNDLNLLVDRGKGSLAAMYIKMKYDPLIDNPEDPAYKHITDAPILEYLCRPSEVYDMYEDVLKAIWFYGCKIFPETNKPGLKNWLRDNGYEDFLVVKPKGITKNDDYLKLTQDGGATSSVPMIQHYTDLTESDVKRNVHKYPFPRLLYQLLHFNNAETQKYDAAVGWGFTLVGCQKKVEKTTQFENVQFFRTYDKYGREII